MLEELENIDDECDALGITFVKIDNVDEAREYGIDDLPALLYFEKGIPTVYEGRLEDEESLLKWLEQQTNSDEIEDITDEMLDIILEKMPYVAVLFCKPICLSPFSTINVDHKHLFVSNEKQTHFYAHFFYYKYIFVLLLLPSSYYILLSFSISLSVPLCVRVYVSQPSPLLWIHL